MRSLVKYAKWLMLVSGILITILGISMLFKPLQNLVSLIIFIGISALISGTSEVISFFGERKEDRSGWALASGIVTIVFGVWVSFGRGSIFLLGILPYVFALWVIASSIMRIISSHALKVWGRTYWVWLMVFGILGIAFGIFSLFAPMISGTIIVYAVALMLISYGANNIAGLIRMKKFENFIRKSLERNKI